MNINEIITDRYILREGYLFRDGYVFTQGQDNPTVYNRLVVTVPQNARADVQHMGRSYRTLDEHIDLINHYQIEKVMIICDDLNFVRDCPSLTDVIVYPSYAAEQNFDYSPLYELPNLKSVNCRTVYGDRAQHKTSIDYSKLPFIEDVTVQSSGHVNFEKISSLKKTWISSVKSIRDFYAVSDSSVLKEVTLLSTGIHNLNGIEKCTSIVSLTFYHNRSLEDISALAQVKETLKVLVVENCSKIKDFSVLEQLGNLEHLQLNGSNTLPNLHFLDSMKNLKTFVFNMKVEDGDLRKCMDIPYASCKNYRHYNLKDCDLPKN